MSQFYCTYSAINTWGNLCMNPASSGLLTQQHHLNMWLVLITLSQIRYVPSAEPQMLTGHLVTCVEVQWTFSFVSLIESALNQLFLVCLMQKLHFLIVAMFGNVVQCSRYCQGIASSSQPVRVPKEQLDRFQDPIKVLCEALMKNTLRC